jgi:glutamate 5-kinase
MAGGAGSSIGKGGMITKILAAKRAAGSGASTVIAWGREPDVLLRLVARRIHRHAAGGADAEEAGRTQAVDGRPPATARCVVMDDGAVAQAARRRQEPAAHRHDEGRGRRSRAAT